MLSKVDIVALYMFRHFCHYIINILSKWSSNAWGFWPVNFWWIADMHVLSDIQTA